MADPLVELQSQMSDVLERLADLEARVGGQSQGMDLADFMAAEDRRVKRTLKEPVVDG